MGRKPQNFSKLPLDRAKELEWKEGRKFVNKCNKLFVLCFLFSVAWLWGQGGWIGGCFGEGMVFDGGDVVGSGD